jgi:hypothetical protein
LPDQFRIAWFGDHLEPAGANFSLQSGQSFEAAVNSASTLATPSLAVQAGIIQLGGNAPTANVTTANIPTAAGGNIKVGLSFGIVPWALLEHLLECLPME